jgi:hypothetical protein
MFPAHFTISIYLPPPPEAFLATSLPFAVANVGAVRHDASPSEIQSGAALLGRLADPLLYYCRKELPAGLLTDAYGPLRKGYHYISRTQRVDPATLAQADVDACATTLTGQSHDISFADAQRECRDSLLSQVSHELPLTTPVLLQVKNP